MTVTHTIGVSYATEAGLIVNSSIQRSGDLEVVLDVALAAVTSNYEYDSSFTTNLLQSLVMNSDQAIVVRTNSSSAPQDTINLAANVPLVWYSGGPVTSTVPFVGNVSRFFVTNSGTVAANIKFRFLANQ